MKISLLLIALFSSAITSAALAQAVEKTVALRNVDGKPSRYATMIPKGGLSVSSAMITSRQVFVLIDTNGGDLADGDEVQLKYANPDGTAANYWQEKDGKIIRVAKADASSTFKVKKTDKGISLQTARGKFVATTAALDPLSVTDTADKAVVFAVVENPDVKPIPAKPAASATASPAASAAAMPAESPTPSGM